MKKYLLILLPVFFFTVFSIAVQNDPEGNGIEIAQNSLIAQNIHSSLWSDVPEGSFAVKGERRTIPLKYRIVKASYNDLKSVLFSAPFEFSDRATNSPLIIELPLPSGGTSEFFLTEYSMMEPGLSQSYPGIKTFNLKGKDDPYSTGKADITINGFHAAVLTPRGDYYIEPYSTDENEIYISYYKNDLGSDIQFECLTPPDPEGYNDLRGALTSGPQLRTYRLAVAATGEYTIYTGGTVSSALSAIVTTINFVNVMFERDLCIRLILISNETQIIYTNPATDPYSTTNYSTSQAENQTNITSVIGSSNYDVGHLLATYFAGGVATVSSVCNNTIKARAVSSYSFPTAIVFNRLVAHELGHQFGTLHTFNSVLGSCNGNRTATTAWEPGSGSTVMSYGGGCAGDNLQNYTDDYYHTGSFSGIAGYSQTGNGNSCAGIINTGNTPPSVTVPAGGFTIPVNTPFELTGSAADLENPNSLTYCWEEYDLGPAGSPNSPTGNAPIFRSFNPDTASRRTFPKLSDLLNNTQTIGEILPSYTRDLSFRLTVRDNNTSGGGVNYELVQFSVNSNAGPFLVTQPNTNVSWNSYVPQTVTWNVANTNVAPVNCQNVNIKLSTNGGITFPTMLIANTPNDGSQTVNLPNITTSQARIKVEASGNIFFDISNTNFSLTNTPVASIINIKVIPQGFYNTLTEKLNMKDTVRAYLHSNVSPYNVLDSSIAKIDSVTFSGSFQFLRPTGTYYIVIKHRNSIETWSRSGGEPFVAGSTMSYDFTDAANKAFGSNMKRVDNSPLRFGIYSGDVNRDGTIGATDLSMADTDAYNFVTGYVRTDVNGNGAVDATDLAIIDFNAYAFVSKVTP